MWRWRRRKPRFLSVKKAFVPEKHLSPDHNQHTACERCWFSHYAEWYEGRLIRPWQLVHPSYLVNCCLCGDPTLFGFYTTAHPGYSGLQCQRMKELNDESFA